MLHHLHRTKAHNQNLGDYSRRYCTIFTTTLKRSQSYFRAATWTLLNALFDSVFISCLLFTLLIHTFPESYPMRNCENCQDVAECPGNMRSMCPFLTSSIVTGSRGTRVSRRKKEPERAQECQEFCNSRFILDSCLFNCMCKWSFIKKQLLRAHLA